MPVFAALARIAVAALATFGIELDEGSLFALFVAVEAVAVPVINAYRKRHANPGAAA